MQLKNKFKKVVQGVNLFTPRILGYYEIENGVIELSTTKLGAPNIFGVTVVLNGGLNAGLSKLFNTEKDAVEYIDTFKPI